MSSGDGTEDAFFDSLFRSGGIGAFEERCDVRVSGVGEKSGNVVVKGIFVLGEPFLGAVFNICGVMSQNKSFISETRRFKLL